MEHSREDDIKQLNSFLRGELSAVETYNQCLEKVEDASVREQLQILLESHRNRAMVLSERVRALGGEPEHSSGVWGSFAKAVEGSAKAFGSSVAVSVLEEGEDHGKHTYEKNVEKLSASERDFVQREIYPEQLRSHDILSALQERV